jgi:hypothetical protein
VLNYFDTSSREEIKGPVTIEITRTGSTPVDTKQASIAKQTVDYMPPKADMETMQVQNFGTVAFRKIGPQAKRKKAPKIAVLTLSNTAIMSAENAALHWRSVTGATQYKIKLYNDRNEPIQPLETTALMAAFDAKLLLPGRSYAWALAALDDETLIEETGGRFWILSTEERAALSQVQKRIETQFDGKSTEKLLLLNLHFQRHKLRDDAAQVLLKLHRLHPKNSMVTSQIKKLNPHLIDQ